MELNNFLSVNLGNVSVSWNITYTVEWANCPHFVCSLKCITVCSLLSSFFFFFSWQSHSEWSTFLQPFVHLFNWFSEKQEIAGSILALSHKFLYASKSRGETKGSPLWVFFGTMRLFFRKFSNSIKGYTLAFFWSFRFVKTLNEPEWPLLSFSALCDFFWKNSFFEKKFFQKFFFEKKFSKCFQ